MASNPPTVERSHSVGFVIQAALVSLAASALGLWVLRWVLDRPLGPEYGEAHHTLRSLLPMIGPAVVFCAVSVLLVGAVGLLILGVLASHKVAGPLFRLQRVAGFVERGILPGRIHLRATDQGVALATALNGFVDRWKGVLAGHEERVASADQAFREWMAARGTAAEPDALARLRALARRNPAGPP